MKRITLFTTAILALSLLISASIYAADKKAPEASAAETKPSGPQPKIVFKDKEYDFGEAKGLDKIEHVFKFRNEGKADLKIDKVKSSCGCTAALASAKVIPPGKEGEIKATFKFGKRRGKQTKHIYVNSNDPAVPNEKLTLSGIIIPAFDVQPSTLYFRDLKTVTSQKVKISQTLAEELKLGNISSRLKLVETKLTEEPSKDGKKHYTLEVSVKPDVAPGRYSDNITVETNNKKKPKIDIPVRFNIRGDIEAIPNRVDLGALEPGKEVKRELKITNRKEAPFKIEKVDIDNPLVTIDLKTPTKSEVSHTLTVKVTPAAKDKIVRAKLVFHTDYNKQEKITVNVYGFIRKKSGEQAAK